MLSVRCDRKQPVNQQKLPAARLGLGEPRRISGNLSYSSSPSNAEIVV